MPRITSVLSVLLACCTLVTALFWGCALLDCSGSFQVFFYSASLAVVVASLVFRVRISKSAERNQEVRRWAVPLDVAAVVVGVAGLITTVADVRVGTYPVNSWLIDLLVCLPVIPVGNSADMTLPPQR